ncbi:MAG: sigma-70 family RNA polymerase sigma factor, partial [Planctomycetota bacterium]|nr:sigma-70 family RNA polymerase sigma factor [Planctomycetota bacterium]
MPNAAQKARKSTKSVADKSRKTTRAKSKSDAPAPPPEDVEVLEDAHVDPAVDASTGEDAKPRRRTRSACSREVTSSYTPDQLREMEMEEVWVLYREYSCGTIRNFLIEKYYDIVHFTAERMHMRLPNEVEVEDLKSAGLFGLMDAIEAFDTERGVKFETYCGTRIRGAIFDELRAMDWVPRLVRARSSKVDNARRDIEMRT